MSAARGLSNSGGSDLPDPPANNSLEELLQLLADLNLLSEDRRQETGDRREKPGSGGEEKKAPLPPFPSYTSLRQRIDDLEVNLASLEQQIYQPTELIDPLLPLIRELLSIKTGESREAILEAVAPVVDEILKRRGREEPQKMSEALAGLLPGAISWQIQDAPAAIARAIAPEVALAIQEQSRLDRHAIARALGPEMGKAIKVQIVEERDAMIDALYPVIGNTISKYMVELVAEINERVEKALSFQGIQRRVRARLQGISEAELILQEAMDFSVQALFLIHKTSGLILWEAQPSSALRLESDLVAGMLTAMREFASDCITPVQKVSELHEIDFDGTKILLEVAGYCYLAAVVAGQPSPAFLQNLRHALGDVVLHHGESIAEFAGDPASVPRAAQVRLEKLIEPEAKKKAKKPPFALLLLLLALLLPLGFLAYRSQVAAQAEKRIAQALDAAPELSVYRLTPEVGDGKLTLTGKVPDASLRARAAQIALMAAPPHLELDNQILAVDLPPTANQLRQVTNLFNLLNLRIHFAFNSSQMEAADRQVLLPFLSEFLAANPQVHLRLVGYSDSVGNKESRQKLAIARARTVQRELIAQGVNPARLHLDSSTSRPRMQAADFPNWLSRCVLFEAFLPTARED